MTDRRTWGKSRSLRLKHFDYRGGGRAYHVIVGTCSGDALFRNGDLNGRVVESLKKASELYGYKLIAYCLMPDHLHILIQARAECKDLKECVGGFKSYTNRIAGRKLWQRGFYEHVLRKDEVVIKVAEYILDNPVRAGLAKRREEYEWAAVLI